MDTCVRVLQRSINSKLVYKRTSVSEEAIRSAFKTRNLPTTSATAVLEEFNNSTNRPSLLSKLKTVDYDLYKRALILAVNNEEQAVQLAMTELMELAETETPESQETSLTTEGEVSGTMPESNAQSGSFPERQPLPVENADEGSDLLASSNAVPGGEPVRSGFDNVVNLELRQGALPKQTYIDSMYGNLSVNGDFEGLSRIALGDEAVVAFYFTDKVNSRDFIEPLSQWLVNHQYPQLGFLKVDKSNNALLYKYREADSNVNFSNDKSIAPIQSSLSAAATQPGDVAVAPATKLKIRSGLDVKTIKGLFSKYDIPALLVEELGKEFKVLKPRIVAGSIEVGYEIDGDVNTVIVYPSEIKTEDDLVSVLAAAIKSDNK